MTTREITINAMFITITALLAIVPGLGVLQIPPISIIFMHIPVIIGAIVYGFRTSVITAITFGVGTLYVAMTRGATPFDLLFTNPILSVGPRLLYGIAVYGIWVLFRNTKLPKNIQYGLTAFLGTVVHAFFVLVFLAYFLGLNGMLEMQFNIVVGFIVTIMISNTLLEAAFAVILTIPLVRVLQKIKR